MKSFCIAAVLLCSAVASAQTELPSPPLPPTYYELGIFQETAGKPCPRGQQMDDFEVQCQRVSLTHINLDNVTCGRLPVETPPDNVPNPLGFLWTDPDDAPKQCRVRAPTVGLSLPIGTKYVVAVRAVAVAAVDGVQKILPTKWSFDTLTFRRAPRGVPCPNGQPGTLFTTEADVNGKPVQLSACINAQ